MRLDSKTRIPALLAAVIFVTSCSSKDIPPAAPPPPPVEPVIVVPHPPVPPPVGNGEIVYKTCTELNTCPQGYIGKAPTAYHHTEGPEQNGGDKPKRVIRQLSRTWSSGIFGGIRSHAAKPVETAELIDCEVGERTLRGVPQAVCDNYQKQWSDLKSGRYQLTAPEEMFVDEKANIRLEVARDKDADAMSKVKEEGDTRVYTGEVNVGGEMFAIVETEEGAFSVLPARRIVKDVDKDPTPVWSWEIQAKKAGDFLIKVRMGYKLTGPGGGFEQLVPGPSRSIMVKSTWLQKWQAWWNGFIQFVETPTGGLTSLAALLAAILAVWQAIRRFGRREGGGEG